MTPPPPRTTAGLSRVALLALCAAVIAGASAASFLLPRLPLLFIWLATACALGTLVALVPMARDVPGERIVSLLLLYGAMVLASLMGIFVSARGRTEAVQVEYRGVHVAGADHLAIGVGDSALDVSLETPLAATQPWSIRLDRGDSGWTARPRREPEELLMSHGATSAPLRAVAGALGIAFWTPVSGTVLGAGDPPRRLVLPARLHPAGTPDTVRLALREEGTRILATVGGESWQVVDRDESISHLRREGLERGRYLSELRPVGASSGWPVGDFVRIRQLRPSERIGEEPTAAALARAIWHRIAASSTGRLLPPSWRPASRFLVTAESPLRIERASGAPVAFGRLGEEARVVARSGGEAWRFSWRPHGDGILIEFLRHPRRRLLPLASSAACPLAAACNLASLKRVPPPSPQFLLSEGGLDSSRFELFGRLSFERDTVWFVGDQHRIPISFDDRGTLVPARALATGGRREPRASLLLVARRGSFSASMDIVRIALGVACILGCLFFMIRAASRQATSVGNSIDERPLALALNGLLALALARLILGTRVTTFPPFEPRGVATALGLWVAIVLALALLLSWRRWYRHVAHWHRRGARFALVQVSHSMRAADPAPARTLLWPLALLAVAMVLLGVTSFDAVTNGLVFGLGVAALWAGLSVAMTQVASDRSAVELRCLQGPWGALEATIALDVRTRDGRRIMWNTALLLVACVCAALAPLAFWLLIVVAAVAGRALRARWPVVSEMTRAAILLAVPIAALASASDSRSAATLALALTVGLFVIRAATSFRQGEVTTTAAGSGRALLADLAGALAPVLLLLPLLATDVGLFLIVAGPIVLAGYVAANVFRSNRLRMGVASLAMLIMVAVFARFLVALPASAIATASPVEVDARVRGLQRFAGLERIGSLRRSLANVASRGLAAKDQGAAERALALAGPSETRDYLLRAIEQTWGTRAYAAGGTTGAGVGESPVGGRGIAEAVAYAENSFAVFVLSENGALGGLALLLCYLLVVAGTVALLLRRPNRLEGAPNLAMRALLVLSLGLLVLPACYVVLSNVGALPITGQNMPFIGLNAWSDVLFCTGILSFYLVAALRLNGEPVGAAHARR